MTQRKERPAQALSLPARGVDKSLNFPALHLIRQTSPLRLNGTCIQYCEAALPSLRCHPAGSYQHREMNHCQVSRRGSGGGGDTTLCERPGLGAASAGGSGVQGGGPDNLVTVGRNGPLPRGEESQESSKKPGPRLAARATPPRGRGEDAQETGPRGGRAGFRGMDGAERRYLGDGVAEEQHPRPEQRASAHHRLAQRHRPGSREAGPGRISGRGEGPGGGAPRGRGGGGACAVRRLRL